VNAAHPADGKASAMTDASRLSATAAIAVLGGGYADRLRHD
jgi:hypothetical protein